MHDAVKYGNAHFYLYSKGHYQQTNPIDDLKHIMSRRCTIDAKHVRVADILLVLLEEVERLTAGRQSFLPQFVARIREDYVVWPAILKPTHSPSLDEVILTACLGELASAKVRDGDTVLIHLGEPDPSVLPLSQPQPHPATASHGAAL